MVHVAKALEIGKAEQFPAIVYWDDVIYYIGPRSFSESLAFSAQWVGIDIKVSYLVPSMAPIKFLVTPLRFVIRPVVFFLRFLALNL